MYFTELTLENIRCFGPRQTLKLTDDAGRPAMWTVILGENGTGKTTLLRCTAELRFHAIQLILKFARTNVSYNENLTEKYSMDSMFKINGINEKYINSRFFPLSLMKIKDMSCHAFSILYTNIGSIDVEAQEGNIITSFKHGTSITTDSLVNQPSFFAAYGATRRSSPNAKDGDDTPTASLFNPNAPLRSAEDWLAQTHHAALMAEGKKENAAKRRLEQVKDLLIKVLPDVHDIELTATDAAIPQIKVMFTTDYGQVELENLSHGYQTMIAWMADFASRLVEAYPDSPNPLAEPAVCMVDEIDLHLHPRWQREIIAYLTNLFPKTQFIVTAHSPLIVQSAENANIALLRKEGDHVVIENDKKLIQGWRIDQILTSDLFGLDSARPPQYAVMMEERRKLLAKKRRTKADKARLAELDEKLDAMPAGESAADREAMDIIRRAAERLKREETAKAAEAGA
jgi:predicted ATP-binding protein involved in virulence